MKPMRLLLIEDDADSAEAIRLLLRLEGIDVEWAASAREALAFFENDPAHHLSALMLDIMLPDSDGVTLVSRMARITTLPPIVIHTASTEAAARVAGKQVGAVAVLRKPTDWVKLREVLRGIDH
jgi:DNA-binding response OmpR family regulator